MIGTSKENASALAVFRRHLASEDGAARAEAGVAILRVAATLPPDHPQRDEIAKLKAKVIDMTATDAVFARQVAARLEAEPDEDE